MKLRNPIIYLARIVGTDCDGHHFGITYNGRVVFPDHESVKGVEADVALNRLANRSLHSHGCYQILLAIRNQRRSKMLRNSRTIPRERRNAIVSARNAIGLYPTLIIQILQDVGFIEQIGLDQWDLVRR